MMAGRSSVDPTYLQDLAESGGAPLVRDVVRTFRETVPPRATTLHAALAAGDLRAAASAAHAIVSSASMVGLTGLQEIAREVEQSAAQGGPVPAARVAALDLALEAAPTQLAEAAEAVLADRPAGGGPAA
jgi:HPt (histidine-containing phosphotransfer) domain-containing protein